jgi:hypothetical protein
MPDRVRAQHCQHRRPRRLVLADLPTLVPCFAVPPQSHPTMHE